jgi:Transposase
MKRSRFTETQIVSILKEADAGRSVKEICRKHGISDATYYNWNWYPTDQGILDLINPCVPWRIVVPVKEPSRVIIRSSIVIVVLAARKGGQRTSLSTCGGLLRTRESRGRALHTRPVPGQIPNRGKRTSGLAHSGSRRGNRTPLRSEARGMRSFSLHLHQPNGLSFSRAERAKRPRERGAALPRRASAANSC